MTWDDVSREAGCRIYRRDFFYDIDFDARRGRGCSFTRAARPELLGTLPADTTELRYELFRGYGDVPYVYGEQYLVTAFDRAGKNTGASPQPSPPDYEGITPRCK